MILKYFSVSCMLLLLALGGSKISVAEVLDMRSVGATSAVNAPLHGTSMENVLAQYGDPLDRLPAVGQPPITRWNYENFTVYFEYNLVIHSVATR